MKTLIALLTLLTLGGCAGMTVRLKHTLADGTVIAADGRTLSVAHGKDVIELELPQK